VAVAEGRSRFWWSHRQKHNSRCVNAEAELEEVLGAFYPWCAGWAAELEELVAAWMKPELCDYMCGHESKSGNGARYGKRKVPDLANEMVLFLRFKVPALNRPPAPHKRRRRTRAQIAADEAAKVGRRAAAKSSGGAVSPQELAERGILNSSPEGPRKRQHTRRSSPTAGTS
jgi:hypothetical protein